VVLEARSPSSHLITLACEVAILRPELRSVNRDTYDGGTRTHDLRRGYETRAKLMSKELLNMARKRQKPGAGGRYRSILVPLDGSRLSERALPLALAIADRARAKLRLVLVSVPRVSLSAPIPMSLRQLYGSYELEARKSERAYLKTLADQLKRQFPSLAVTSRTLTGPVGRTLLEYVRDSRSDLVVMTSRGQGGLRRLWLGSVADAMIRRSSVPVLLVRPDENASPRPVLENLSQILTPLDGSALSETILGPAMQLASLAGAELMLVEVIQPLASSFEGQSTAPLRFDVELTNSRRKEAADYLKGLAEECLKAGVQAAYSAPLSGNVADAILGLAESPTVGLIAIATHGLGGMKRLALGSVADKLVRTAPRPILVYRPVGDARGGGGSVSRMSWFPVRLPRRSTRTRRPRRSGRPRTRA
jgi:nucleotide-binding universal stress UspA family protein